MFYHDHAMGITRLNVYAGEAAGYLLTGCRRNCELDRQGPPRRRRSDPAGHPGQDVRGRRNIGVQDPTWNWGTGTPAVHRPHRQARCSAGPEDGRPLVAARLPAGPEPVRPRGHERDGPLELRPLVLSADAGSRTARSRTRTATAVPGGPCAEPRCSRRVPGTPNPPGAPRRSWTRRWSTARLSHADRAAEGVPFPHPERRQRPVLEPAALQGRHARSLPVPTCAQPTRKSRWSGRARHGPAGQLAARRPAGGVPDPDDGRAELHPDRHRRRLPAQAGRGPEPAGHLEPRSADVQRRQRGTIALLLGPAERADVIVDFSRYAGKTLILYNDAPAPFPALTRATTTTPATPTSSIPAAPADAARLRPQHPHHHADQGGRRRGDAVRPGRR